jgi:PAS domain S-box-containing protein
MSLEIQMDAREDNAFRRSVADRFGVLPNFFCSAPAAPGLIERLWDFAQSAYLDNPLPSLFKERLFVHLSRFCVVRYCIVRHVGFLIAYGRPAGDATVAPETIDEVIRLLSRPVPDAAGFERALAALGSIPQPTEIPVPDAPLEYDLFDGLTILFLTPVASSEAGRAIRAAVGDTNFEYLVAFLAFIRAAHYWTEVHSDLAFEPDMLALMERHAELARLLLDPGDAEQSRGALERAQALAALRESEERFRAVVDLVPDLLWRIGPDTQATWCNKRWAEYTGLSAAETAGEGWLQALHPIARSPILTAIEAGLHGGTSYNQEHRMRRQDGAYRWFLLRGEPIRDESGRITGWFASATDIDDQRRAAKELEASERRLREVNQKLQDRAERRVRELGASRAQMQAIFDNSPDWLTLFHATADGRFVYADLNHATERAYGLPYDRIVGRTVEEILGVEQAQLPLRMMRACIATGDNQRYTARRTMAGVTCSIDVMFVRVPKRDGDYYIMSTARDTTERDAIEEQLRQAQKMEAVGQLTGGVAHDFNNLLQVVLGNLDGLRRRVNASAVPTRSEITRSVEGAIRGAERAASLTQQLLAFSRRQPLEPRAIDVNRLVRGMSELLRRTLGESISIKTALSGELWRVYADANQLENSIINLAVNARDAMANSGMLKIESSNANLDEVDKAEQQAVQPGPYVMLAISDTGTGMAEEVIASAFEPFFTTKDVGQGTGLGLSQVYGFVKQSNGHVKIDSELGKGTTVRIYLPRLAGDAAVGEDVAVSAAPFGDGSEIVLLVEDDEAVRELNATMLRELNYPVIEAADGTRALQIIEMVPNIRLLFTDVGLPGGMNGRELADAALRLRPSVRILFTTGYARSAIVHHGRLDPGIELISKPFTAAALATKIRGILDHG